MSLRSRIQTASLGVLFAILTACGGSDAFAPESARVASSDARASSVELLVNIASPTYDEGNPPNFSLSSLPATTMAGSGGRFSRTIAIEPNDPFAPAVAVDYGTGAGAQSVSVNQSGGVIDFKTGAVSPISYSFVLSRTYTAPGTYTIRVGAQTSQGKRIRTHTITVTPDLTVYLDSVVVFGSEAGVRGGAIIEDSTTYFSGWWRGPAGVQGITQIDYGDGSTASIESGPGVVSGSHRWAEPGTYTLRLITTAGAYADTASAQVVVTAGEIVCEAGSYLFEGACRPAPSGTYVPEAGATFPLNCAPGTYQNESGQTSCKTAPAGYYVDVAGAAVPNYCAAGTYQDLAGQTSCKEAPVGTFVAVGRATSPTPCAVGSYQGLEGQRACLPAPAGTYVPTVGATAAIACPVGTYQDQAGQTACLAAPVGTYVATTGAAAATSCPLGTTTLGTGATSASQCVSNAQILTDAIAQASANGTLVGLAPGNRGVQQLAQWRAEVSRSLAFLAGPQQMAGCRGLRNQLAQADGNRTPVDHVTGTALPAIRALLQRVLDENGC